MIPPMHPFVSYDSWQTLSEDQRSKESVVSLRTVHRTSSPHPSSAPSRDPISSVRLRVINGGSENVPLGDNTSQSSLLLASNSTNVLSQRRVSKPAGHKSSWGSESLSLHHLRGPLSPLSDAGTLEDLDLNAASEHNCHSSLQALQKDHVPISAIEQEISIGLEEEKSTSIPKFSGDTSERSGALLLKIVSRNPNKVDFALKDWVSALGPNSKRRLAMRKERWTLDEFEDDIPSKPEPLAQRRLNGHHKASSWSTSAFVDIAKKAVGNAVASNVEPWPHRPSRPHFLRSNRSSRISATTNRASLEDSQTPRETIELAALNRAVQRSQVLEELVTSEESYINDLKVLLHVYLKILGYVPKTAQAIKPEISRNVEEMLVLHEEILKQMKMILRRSNTQFGSRDGVHRESNHGRLYSTGGIEDTLAEKVHNAARRSKDFSWFGLSKKLVFLMTPCEAADFAHVFESMLERFVVYEEYAAKYESMLTNMATLSRTMPNWSAYERGIEGLMNSLIPPSTSADDAKKGLTLEDLLIKPVQRVCRYPLLFAELHKHTPAIDSQQSQAEIEKVLSRLRETAKEINKATNDQKTQAKIQRSWHLQDLLVFPHSTQPPISLRLLGHPSLCGVLYVAYQSKKEIRGKYMLCALFESYLLLAQPRPLDAKFEVAAIISLSDLQTDKTDNGRGLQCCSALFSWKITFEFDQQLHELIFCACTAREEEQWKSGIEGNCTMEKVYQLSWLSITSFEHSVLFLDIRPLGPVFGQPGTLMRRQSIQRAATLDSRNIGCKVIIKNTAAIKERGDLAVAVPESVSCSQSLLPNKKVPILSPKRIDRQRMEQLMASVWTRDRIPYPGMARNRGGSFIISATTAMRKLSKASTITTSTTDSVRRSFSYSSTTEDSSQPGDVVADCSSQINGTSGLKPDQRQPTLSRAGSEDTESERGRRDALSSSKTRFASIRKLRDVSFGGKWCKSREVSGTSTVLADQEMMDVEQKKGKLRKPRTLLRVFSTEGIRGWFH